MTNESSSLAVRLTQCPLAVGQMVRFVEPTPGEAWLNDWQNVDCWVVGIQYDIKGDYWIAYVVDRMPFERGDVTDCNADFLVATTAQRALDEARKEAFRAGAEAMREKCAIWIVEGAPNPQNVYDNSIMEIYRRGLQKQAASLRNLQTPEMPDDHA